MTVGQVAMKLYYETEADARLAADWLLAESLYAEVVQTPVGGWATAVHVQAGEGDLDRIRAEIDRIVAGVRSDLSG
jgi:hypothetical protein